jgi:hypothetical protein
MSRLVPHLPLRSVSLPAALLALFGALLVVSPVRAQDGFDSCGTGLSCFEENLFAPGCEDPTCCEAVCTIEPACCEIAWDKLCVAIAKKECSNCGSGSNSCFEVSPEPACNDYLVCEEVCAVLPECCEIAWDQDCVNLAEKLCTGCGAPCNGPCTEARPDRPGCRNEECCELVCEFNPRCCQIAWDASCADLARDVCLECGTPAAGNCCLARDTPFCNDRDCCETVCTTLDPYCCDVRWDEFCATIVAGNPNLCPGVACVCGPDGPGGEFANCKAVSPTPGCADFTCCQEVCLQDPFCCAIAWDESCASLADAICAFNDACGVPGSGSCFIPNDSPGCDDPGCCDRVCRVPGFQYCCEASWDEECARAALEFCNDCGDVDSGSCFQPHGNPNCYDESCCNDVCAIDDFCCTVQWDLLCVSIARANCPSPIAVCGDNRNRSCFVAGAIGGCSNEQCCQEICLTIDPYCCEASWDEVCVAQAAAICSDQLLTSPGRGPCLEPHPIPGCSDALCATAVCDLLPVCCELGWDQRCAEAARAICIAPDSGGGENNCNEATAAPGCNDPSCEAAVCFLDPSCCETAWDAACVSLANFNCSPESDWNCPCEGGCLEDKTTPGCSDKSCCSAVCRYDPACCEVAWDESCVTLARAVCCNGPGCGDNCAGSCLLPHDTPYCDDPFCCEAVCAVDPVCCSSSWDVLCVELAIDRCTGGCGLPSAGSCFGVHPTAGCDDPVCCAAVCKVDPVCCEATWDDVCVEQAVKICTAPECGDFETGDCCVANGTPRCRDGDCCEEVCKVDPVCCDFAWDLTCVQIARDTPQCQDCQAECGDPCAGSCCTPRFAPFCNDGECCDAVCQIDPFCCEGQWDEFCAATARQLGNPGDPCFGPCPIPQCGEPEAGGCCKPNGTPNCSDEDCCDAVCDLDPFCCEGAWDLTCALLAIEECEVCDSGLACGDPDTEPCDEPHDTPYCDDAECCEFVCLLDATCCSVAWDEACVQLADLFCTP